MMKKYKQKGLFGQSESGKTMRSLIGGAVLIETVKLLKP